jgi:succinoglycan biosynthesis transport protein ExoP
MQSAMTVAGALNPLRNLTAETLEKNTDEHLRLAQGLFLLAGRVGPKSVVFAGVETGNGTTTVTVGAAMALAKHTAGTVCLVDGNLRRPSLHIHFGVKNLKGLADAVCESGPIRQFTQPLRQRNLRVLSAGFHLSDPASLFGDERLKHRMAELRAEFDYVLIDAPAVNAHADPVFLGRLADGIVLVVEAGVTRRDRAVKCKRTLEDSEVKILGTVLNKQDFPIPDFISKKL